jgi:hypothetical protein
MPHHVCMKVETGTCFGTLSPLRKAVPETSGVSEVGPFVSYCVPSLRFITQFSPKSSSGGEYCPPLPLGFHMCVIPAREASLECPDNGLREDVNLNPPVDISQNLELSQSG